MSGPPTYLRTSDVCILPTPKKCILYTQNQNIKTEINTIFFHAKEYQESYLYRKQSKLGIGNLFIMIYEVKVCCKAASGQGRFCKYSQIQCCKCQTHLILDVLWKKQRQSMERITHWFGFFYAMSQEFGQKGLSGFKISMPPLVIQTCFRKGWFKCWKNWETVWKLKMKICQLSLLIQSWVIPSLISSASILPHSSFLGTSSHTQWTSYGEFTKVHG